MEIWGTSRCSCGSKFLLTAYAWLRNDSSPNQALVGKICLANDWVSLQLHSEAPGQDGSHPPPEDDVLLWQEGNPSDGASAHHTLARWAAYGRCRGRWARPQNHQFPVPMCHTKSVCSFVKGTEEGQLWGLQWGLWLRTCLQRGQRGQQVSGKWPAPAPTGPPPSLMVPAVS